MEKTTNLEICCRDFLHSTNFAHSDSRPPNPLFLPALHASTQDESRKLAIQSSRNRIFALRPRWLAPSLRAALQESRDQAHDSAQGFTRLVRRFPPFPRLSHYALCEPETDWSNCDSPQIVVSAAAVYVHRFFMRETMQEYDHAVRSPSSRLHPLTN